MSSNYTMGFGQAISLGFSNYVNFNTRSTRAEYWWFTLFQILAYIAAAILDAAINPRYAGGDVDGPIGILVALALFIPSMSITVRRFHDVNRSGWWMLAIVVPMLVAFALISTATTQQQLQMFLGFGIIVTAAVGIMLLIWTCMDGTVGPNNYGADPKGRYVAGQPAAA